MEYRVVEFTDSLNNQRRQIMQSWSILKGASFLLAIATAIFPADAAMAQAKFPTKPVSIVVPYAAGASNDLAARVIASYLENRWSTPVRVVNKTGGNTIPAASDVMHSAPDGHTVYIDGLAQSSMLEVVVKEVPFNVLDRTYLGTFGSVPLMLAVSGNSPYKTLAEVAAAWKAKPDVLSWASVGGTSTIDMTMRRFARAAGVNIAQTRPVNLKGGAEATTMLAGGHIDLAVGTLSTLAPHHAAGRVRILAVATPQRLDAIPDVPTTSQAGFKDVEVFNWIGLSGPANLPANVVAAWQGAIKDMTNDQALLKKLDQVGATRFYNDAKSMREMVIRDKKIVEQLWPEFTK
jgi:tripartite-type tricarboxylate transporter receptor subunit TctC